MKLVIYKDLQSNFRAEVVTFIPDSSYVNGNKNQLTGVVSVNSWSGSLYKGFRYTNSKSFAITGGNSSKIKVDAVKPNVLPPPEICTYIDYYSCAGTAENPYQSCEYDFTNFIGCVPEYGGLVGGGDINIADGSAVVNGQNTVPTAANYDYTPASTICGGGYNWQTIGQSWTTQFAPMIFQIIYEGEGPLQGTINGYTIQAGCWEIPKARASTQSAADQVVNSAWNYAVSQVPNHANLGNGVSNAAVIRAFVADVMNWFKQNNYGTSATFNPTGCTGSVAITPAPPPCQD
jgi:hypothetical protein